MYTSCNRRTINGLYDDDDDDLRCQDESVVSTEISRLKLQLQTSLSERGVFEMKIAQLTDDLKRIETERDEVRAFIADTLSCVDLPDPLSKLLSWASVCHNQQPGHTTLQSVNLWHPCF